MAYLYRHIRLDKNEVFYIGIGSDKEDNQGKYIRGYAIWNRSRYWKNIALKTMYEVEIVLDNLTWEEAIQKEIEFIKLYGRKDLVLGTLCNHTNGGEGTLGRVVTNNTKKKIGAANKGRKHTEEFKEKNRIAHLGIKQSPQTIEKRMMKVRGKPKSPEAVIRMTEAIRKVWVGKKHTEESKRKMSLSLKGKAGWNGKLVFNTQTGIFYDSVRQAGLTHNIGVSHLQRMLCGRLKNKTNLTYV